MFQCRMCAENPFSKIFGGQTSPQAKAQDPRPRKKKSNASKRDDEWQPRSEEDVAAIVAQWETYAHPRAREFFTSPEMLRDVLVQLAKGTDKNYDPILGREDKCVYWYGDVTKEDLQAAIKMIKPGEQEESVTYVNRVLAFIFATDDSFEALMRLPKEPFKMSCDDQLCVHLAHISLAV
mmetsp:Transcript_100523/g.194093  ORF Transcript_100523/g.194093 Transcript_100523/m.194093 type:complete len:179 (+) Transcript_100523:78-614(+)